MSNIKYLDFEKIAFRLKLEIEKIEKEHKNITNKKLANYLNIKQNTFNTYVYREVIPYRQIIEFCLRYKIDINTIFCI